MADALVTQLARALNLSPDSARHTLNHLVAALREQIDATGEAAVPGLGTFHRDGAQLAFTPDDALARAVNHRYAGLRAISAGPSRSRRPAPEEETPAAEFQPLEAFIEPAESEVHDIAEADLEPDEAASDDAETEQEEVLPLTAAETAAEEEIAEEEEPTAEEEPVVEEDDTMEREPDEVADSVDEEDITSDALDEMLSGMGAATSDLTDDEPPLDAMQDEYVEEADYPVAEPDDEETLDYEEVSDDDLGRETLDAEVTAEASTEGTTDEALDFDEVAETEEPEFVEAEDDDQVDAEGAPVLAPEPTPVTETEPEPPAESVAEPPAPAVAPAVSATAATKSADRPAEAPRSGTGRWLGGLAAVLLIALVALLWFLRRDTDGPTVAERPPAPADTVAALPPPVDTSAVAVDTAAAATPEPAAPAPSADPLRSTAGIDRADGGFSWIVGSEFSLAPAERRVATFREQGFRADVIAEEANGRTRYRVALGQFSSIEEADRFRSDLPAGVPADTWLLRL